MDNRKDTSPLSRKPKNIKNYNQRLVLSLLRNSNHMTASEISDRINLSVTSVTKILAALQKQNLVKSMGKGNSTEEGGKKPELFALNDTYRYVISVGSGGDGIHCAVSTLKCKIVDTYHQQYRDSENFEQCMEDIAAAVDQLVLLTKLQPTDICGIVVAFDGIVDTENGILLFPIHNTGWGRNLTARQKLQELMVDYRNIAINNGSRLSGYAELIHHPDYAQENILMIASGSSTGGCVLDHGKMIQGANGFVGEVGHITVAPTYRVDKCACGNYGCFETMVSPKALITYAKEIKGEYTVGPLIGRLEELDYEEIFEASNQKDAFACRIMDQVISYFVLLIRDIVLIYDPKVIALQGIYTQAGAYFLNNLQKEIHSLPFFKIEKELKIVYSDLSFQQGCFTGGALYLADQYFNEADIFVEQEENELSGK
jgi:predicted NBD/HSP70 family sugar kinase